MTKTSTFWIRFYHYECPVCGASDEIRERVFDTPKPDDPNKRHIFKQQYDYCNEMQDVR